MQITRDTVKLNETRLAAGDGDAIAEEDAIALQGISPGVEVLLFDMSYGGFLYQLSLMFVRLYVLFSKTFNCLALSDSKGYLIHDKVTNYTPK